MNNRKALITVVSFALSSAICFSCPVLADQERYLSLGKDLSESQKKAVENLLGVDNESDYQITYVTNAVPQDGQKTPPVAAMHQHLPFVNPPRRSFRIRQGMVAPKPRAVSEGNGIPAL